MDRPDTGGIQGLMEKPAAKPAPAKPFKSAMAAKFAMAKAEKAYSDARCRANSAYRDAMAMDKLPEGFESCSDYHDAMEAAASAAYDVGAAVYAKAKAEGHWVKSWYFGHNPTRDLIAANID